jgi:transcriptional repressor NrdR
MRCPWCNHDDDRVVDSRPAEHGSTIRRRRECGSCGRRYTTFERIEELGLMVTKRGGLREPYDREKVLSGLRKALANRPVAEHEVAALADRVGERLRSRGPEVTSQEVGFEVLAGLKQLDQVAYMRFASVYKDFQEITDFEHELGLLLQRRSPPSGSSNHYMWW